MNKENSKRRGRNYRHYFSWLLVTSISILIFATVFRGCTSSEINRSEEEIISKKEEYVIGNLGGMRVRIPRYFVENVEYNEEENTKLLTFESRFRSFGIDARYPDMIGLENSGIQEARRKEPLKNNWLRIAINSGSDYPGDGFLDRLAAGTLENFYSKKFSGHWRYSYERFEENFQGLEVWVLSMKDPRTNKPARFSEDTKDVYLHRDEKGKVAAYIECNRTYVAGGVSTCNLISDLEPKAKVSLKVSFAFHLLPEWIEILRRSKKLLIDFEINGTESKK
ncbi:MAG: hypothetical protein U1E04_13195 [Hylemonella sp.]|nr:hypothetical protein [Hylemonella sp.]